MSYVAEPYAQFVDDLLTGLTGGHVRETFRMASEESPFRLSSEQGVKPNTVRVYGQKKNRDNEHTFHRFRFNVDYSLVNGRDVVWKTKNNGLPAVDSDWPAEGSVFYVNYESVDSGFDGPQLTDRSVGSVTRLLAESIGREYAVLSGQMEKIYQAGFLETATGRDLDNLVALVGIKRWGRDVAEGQVSFSRSTPAPADITISAGTRISTIDAPAQVFETAQTVTLQRGQLSVDAPIQAIKRGSDGIVAAATIVASNRPVLGIDAVSNDEPTAFAAAKESDTALRLRARRALESAGKASVGALLGALTGLPGVREKDIRFTEDPIEHPGIVNMDIALPALSTEQQENYKRRAVALLEETRPVGVRIRHNIEAAQPATAAPVGGGQDTALGSEPPVTTVTPSENLHQIVDAKVVLQPLLQNITPAERELLIATATREVENFIGEAGLGETLVYNRLIAQLMALDGVVDVSLELYPASKKDGPRARNILPGDGGTRPVPGAIDVQVGNALVALDLVVEFDMQGVGLQGDASTSRSSAIQAMISDLQKGLNYFSGSQIDAAALAALIEPSTTYRVKAVSYKRVDYMDTGVRIENHDFALPYTGLDRFWVRSLIPKPLNASNAGAP